jgi:hypothetical protein
MFDAIPDSFNKRLIETARDADRPRKNITGELCQTEPIESDTDWWCLRSFLIATDKDKTGFDLSMGERLNMREN